MDGMQMNWNNAIRRRKLRQGGSAIVEFGVMTPILFGIFFGTISSGIVLGRFIQAQQVCRDVAHMYSDGIDFSQTTSQNIIVNELASGTGMTATAGNGVVILSEIMTPYASDCTASGVSPCTNQGLPVFIQRLTIGNSTLHTSQFGTPTSTLMDANGNISAAVYLGNTDSSVRTSGFEARLDAANVAAGGSGTAPQQAQGNISYVVETYFQYPDIGFLSYVWGGLIAAKPAAGGAYSVFIFQ